MSLVRSLAALLPAGAVKEWLRFHAYNYKYRGRARFFRTGETFTTEMAGTRFHTRQAPYGIPALLDEYQHWYKVRPGDVIVEAGAHHGMVMLGLAALTGPSGRVIALEPDDLNRRILAENLELNPEFRHIHVLPEALWDTPGTIEFCERGAPGSSAFWDVPGAKKTAKRTITLDGVIERFGLQRLDLVVINAEGAELKALGGARRVLRDFHPVFAIASNHFVAGKYTTEAVEQELQRAGYEYQTVRHSDGEWSTYGRPRAR